MPGTTRPVGRERRPVRFHSFVCTCDAPPWGVRVDKLAESRKLSHTRFVVYRPLLTGAHEEGAEADGPQPLLRGLVTYTVGPQPLLLLLYVEVGGGLRPFLQVEVGDAPAVAKGPSADGVYPLGDAQGGDAGAGGKRRVLD